MKVRCNVCVCVCVCVCLVTQLCLTLCDLMDYSPPGSSVHGILQARILEWVAIPFSRRIFPTQEWNPGLPHRRWILYHLSHQGSPILCVPCLNLIAVFNTQQSPSKNLYTWGGDMWIWLCI